MCVHVMTEIAGPDRCGEVFADAVAKLVGP
jgi:hypothetical protein